MIEFNIRVRDLKLLFDKLKIACDYIDAKYNIYKCVYIYTTPGYIYFCVLSKHIFFKTCIKCIHSGLKEQSEGIILNIIPIHKLLISFKDQKVTLNCTIRDEQFIINYFDSYFNFNSENESKNLYLNYLQEAKNIYFTRFLYERIQLNNEQHILLQPNKKIQKKRKDINNIRLYNDTKEIHYLTLSNNVDIDLFSITNISNIQYQRSINQNKLNQFQYKSYFDKHNTVDITITNKVANLITIDNFNEIVLLEEKLYFFKDEHNFVIYYIECINTNTVKNFIQHYNIHNDNTIICRCRFDIERLTSILNVNYSFNKELRSPNTKDINIKLEFTTNSININLQKNKIYTTATIPAVIDFYNTVQEYKNYTASNNSITLELSIINLLSSLSALQNHSLLKNQTIINNYCIIDIINYSNLGNFIKIYINDDTTIIVYLKI